MALRLDEWRLKMTENVQRTLTQLSGASDKAAAKFMGAQNRIQNSVGRMSNGIRQGIGSAWNAAGSQLQTFKANMLSSLPIPPQMGAAIGALAGPLGIAIGLVAALGLGLVKGVQAAEAFGVPFRELRNLNMDKSAEQIDALNDSLLKLSFDKGLDAQAITKGYYDIQSATGLYGQEVLDMTGRIGEAARALNMDYSASVNGVSKAMLAFKLQASDLDAVMTSNAKTVQVGVVTFDELAKSQTEFAGAAASVNQEMDTANKVFAALSQSTKNAQVAATMTKGAFQDLGKASTSKGLKKIGVDVYDATGAMRQADDILRDLVPQLAQMSDQTFSALKEEIGGSEGLRGLLDQAKGSGDNLLRTMDAFDASQFDLNKAIAQGNNDLDIMKDKLGNQINAKFIELGQLVMPLVVKMMQGFSWILDKVMHIGRSLHQAWAYMQELYNSSWMVRSTVEGLFATIEAGWSVLKNVIMAVIDGMMTPLRAMAKAMQGDFSGAFDALVDGAGSVVGHLVDGAKGVATAYGDALSATFNTPQTMDVVPVVATPVIPGTNMPVVPGPAPGTAGKGDPFAALFNGGGKGDGTGVKQGVSEVVGGGKQVRNVTVNIQSLVRELVIHSGSVRESAVDMQRQITEGIVRAVNGAEVAVAND
jgi:TP901 family phage tail tape measure protein